MSYIYKIDKPETNFTIADLILELSKYDLDSHVVFHDGQAYACKEDPTHPYYRPKCYDLEYETKRITCLPYQLRKL